MNCCGRAQRNKAGGPARHIALILAAVTVLSVCLMGVTAYASGSKSEVYDSLDDLAGKKIGVITGTPFDTIAKQAIDDPEIMYVQTFGDAILAVKGGKVDAVVSDEAYARYLISTETDLAIIDESMQDQDLGLAFSKTEKGRKYCEELNTCLEKWSKNGTLDNMMDSWINSGKNHPKIDLHSLPATNGTINFITDPANPPLDFMEDNQIVGYEIDILYRFCKIYGYGLNVTSANFDALIPSITTGKYDVAGCSIAITEERKETVLFCNPICTNRVVLLINKEHTAAGATESGESFFTKIRTSFTKSFVTENRWKLYVSGIGQTLFITILSIILGTALGFVLYMWYWTGDKVAKSITVVFDWLMNRMPMVVLLMILFYVVFAKSEISGTAVSIFGFTLVFASNVYGMIKGGVNAIDKGQMEAGLALGYKPLKAFFKVVFPQASLHFMPNYEGSIITLINSTSIVGYVAVQDLTKVSDIVRSRTYEAFFPLIVTAVIYIILAELLIAVVKIAEKIFMPRKDRRSKFMKGVRK